MRTFTVTIGLIGVLASHAAFAQEPAPGGATQPPPAEAPPPPPAVAAPGTGMGAPTPFGAAGPTGPSVWGVLPWGGYGMGAHNKMPLPISPLLTRTKFRDYWALEFGADILRFSYDYGLGTSGSYSWTEIIPVVGMMWHLPRRPGRFALQAGQRHHAARRGRLRRRQGRRRLVVLS